MKKIFHIFAIKKEERLLAIVIALLLITLNTAMVASLWDIFSYTGDGFYKHIIRHFHISGFDPITYCILTRWSDSYNVYRHPLLAFFMYLPYLINQALMWLTGVNCALPLGQLIVVFSAFYSAIFLGRIFREVIGIGSVLSFLLTLLYFSFGYVMVTCLVADHFVISQLLLIMALYVSGRRMLSGRQFKPWQTVVYFLLTAGTSLNNGLKIWLSALFVNGKRTFRPAHLLAIIVPAVLLWGFARWEYKTFVLPHEKARKAQRALEKKKKEERIAKLKAQGKTIKKRKPRVVQGKPFVKGEFMNWTDATTSRREPVVENLFGESIQLHRDHLLQDTLINRPVIVRYGHWWYYTVEAVVCMLFLAGIWMGRRSKFFWLAMSFFILDMALHLGLGFGMNEIYIMTCHYMFVVPIAMAFLLRDCPSRMRPYLTALTAVLALYLLGYNGSLIIGYFC